MFSSIMHHYPTCQWHILSFSQNHNVFIRSSDGSIRLPFLDSTDSLQMNRNQESNCQMLILRFHSSAEKWQSRQASSSQLPRLQCMYFMHITRGSGSLKITIYFRRRGGDLNQFLPAAVCRKFHFYSTSTELHRYWVP